MAQLKLPLAILGIMVLVIFLITSGHIRKYVFTLIQSVVRNLMNTVNWMHPQIMKLHISELKKKHEQIQQQIDALKGQLIKINKQVNANKETIKLKFTEASKAVSVSGRPNMREQAQLFTTEGVGLQEMNDKLLNLHQRISLILDFMEKINQSADYIIRETEIKIRIKETEYQLVKESSGMFKNAVGVFKSDGANSLSFNSSGDYIEDEISQKLIDLKQAMNLSMDFINGADIQNGLLSTKGTALLDAYLKNEFKASQSDTTSIADFIAEPLDSKVQNHTVLVEKLPVNGR